MPGEHTLDASPTSQVTLLFDCVQNFYFCVGSNAMQVKPEPEEDNENLYNWEQLRGWKKIKRDARPHLYRRRKRCAHPSCSVIIIEEEQRLGDQENAQVLRRFKEQKGASSLYLSISRFLLVTCQHLYSK